MNPNRRGRASGCALAVALLAGCGGSLPAASQPQEARQLLTTALDAWKQGAKPDSLATGTPPIRVLDREWADGFVLQGYELVGDGQPLGLNVQQSVALGLKNPKGKAIKKTINYVVTTGKQPVLARQDIDE